MNPDHLISPPNRIPIEGWGMTRALATFVVSLVTCSILLHQLYAKCGDRSRGYGFDTRLAHLRENGDAYNCVFIGNSRAFRSVRPPTLDATTASEGVHSLSFNLAAENLTLLEASALVEAIESMDLKRLKWIFIEPTLPDSPGKNWCHPRAVAIHDLGNTLSMLSYYWKDSSPFGDLSAKLKGSLIHMASFVAHYSNAGRLPSLILPALPRDRESNVWRNWEQEQGFRALHSVSSAPMVRRLEAERSERKYEAEQEEIPFENSRLKYFANLARVIRARDQVPVLLLSPTWGQLPEHALFLRHRTQSEFAAVLDGRGQRYVEEFYAPQLWADPGHLNADGARVYSKFLGRKLSGVLRGGT